MDPNIAKIPDYFWIMAEQPHWLVIDLLGYYRIQLKTISFFSSKSFLFSFILVSFYFRILVASNVIFFCENTIVWGKYNLTVLVPYPSLNKNTGFCLLFWFRLTNLFNFIFR